MRFKIKRNIFPVTIEVVLHNDKPRIPFCLGLTTFIPEETKILIEFWNKDEQFVVHEISHCIDFIENFIDERIESEIRAYFSQSLFVEIVDNFAKNSKKENKRK